MFDDFPILNDVDYFNLMQQYNMAKPFDKSGQISQVFLHLNACFKFCFVPKPDYNFQLLQALKNVKDKLETCINNLKTSFNFGEDKYEVKQINIFTFLFKLNDACNILFNLYLKEEKIYNKKNYTACINILNDAIKDILLALQNSNIKMFKYM